MLQIDTGEMATHVDHHLATHVHTGELSTYRDTRRDTCIDGCHAQCVHSDAHIYISVNTHMLQQDKRSVAPGICPGRMLLSTMFLLAALYGEGGDIPTE